MLLLKLMRYFLLVILSFVPLLGRDTLLEFKGAYFLPIHSIFKNIYHNGSALYGPELSVQLCNNKDWYGFVSINYFQKKGQSLGLCDSTKVSLIPLGIGLKYFVPIVYDRADFYVGLGFQPVYVRTKNYSEFVIEKQSQWGFGGISKVGTYVYLPCNFLLDFFIDYSFVKVGCDNKPEACTGIIIPTKANVSGVIFGVGLGYRF